MSFVLVTVYFLGIAKLKLYVSITLVSVIKFLKIGDEHIMRNNENELINAEELLISTYGSRD